MSNKKTIEQAAEKEYPTIHELYQYDAFIKGANWQAKTMYELMDSYADDVMGGCNLRAKEWFEQLKQQNNEQ